MRKEEKYRRELRLLVLQKVGGWCWHPADYPGAKARQPDLLWAPNKPVMIETKRWDRKHKAWTFRYEKKRNPDQTGFYELKTREGFLIFYAIFNANGTEKRRESGLPDRIFCVSTRKYVSFTAFLKKIAPRRVKP